MLISQKFIWESFSRVMLANISTTSNFRRSFNPHVHLVKSRRELCKRHIFQYKNIIIDFFCKSEPTSRCLHPSLRLKVNLFSEMVTPFFLCAKITWLGIVSPLGISSIDPPTNLKEQWNVSCPVNWSLTDLLLGTKLCSIPVLDWTTIEFLRDCNESIDRLNLF